MKRSNESAFQPARSNCASWSSRDIGLKAATMRPIEPLSIGILRLGVTLTARSAEGSLDVVMATASFPSIRQISTLT